MVTTARKRKLKEEFKPIPGFPNYLISNYGYVLNEKFGREMTLSPTMWGDLTVGLTHNNKTKTFRVHRLVAEAFLDGYDDNYEVEHEGEKTDNCVLNLKMGTRKKGGRRKKVKQ